LLENSSLAACGIRAVWTRKDHEEIEIAKAQIAFILRQDTAVVEICRKAGMSEATYYN